MDKGYSGLNPYKNNSITSVNNIIDTRKVEAIRAHDNVIVVKTEDLVSEHVEEATKGHPYSRPKYAPIKVPYNTDVKKQSKNGYEQVKYTWRKGQYRYEARWHTPNPDSPIKQQSWVISRIKPGSNSSPRVVMIRVGNKWVPHSVWQAAIVAKRNGTATKSQLNLLSKGHFTRKRGKK